MTNEPIYSVLTGKPGCLGCSWGSSNVHIVQDPTGEYGLDLFSRPGGAYANGWYYRRSFGFNSDSYIPNVVPSLGASNSTNETRWKPGYPEALEGTVYKWVREVHYYSQRFANGSSYLNSEYSKHTLYQCQEGVPVDITNQAVIAGTRKLQYYCCPTFVNGNIVSTLVCEVVVGTQLDYTESIDESVPPPSQENDPAYCNRFSASWNTNGNTTITRNGFPSTLLTCP